MLPLLDVKQCKGAVNVRYDCMPDPLYQSVINHLPVLKTFHTTLLNSEQGKIYAYLSET